MTKVRIPKLIKSPNRYKVDVSFYELLPHLDRLRKDQEKDGYSFTLEPEFQRGHVWTEEQQSKYIEWMLMGGDTGRTLIFNHPHWHSDYRANMVCVDGLQRITAVRKFFDGELKVFGHYFEDFTDSQIRRASWFEVVVGNFSETDVLLWYLQLNGGGTAHSKEELERVQKLLDEKQAKNRVDDINNDLFA